MRDVVTTVVELAGFVCLVVAGFLVSVLLGLVVAGVSLIVLGWLFGRRG